MTSLTMTWLESQLCTNFPFLLIAQKEPRKAEIRNQHWALSTHSPCKQNPSYLVSTSLQNNKKTPREEEDTPMAFSS